MDDEIGFGGRVDFVAKGIREATKAAMKQPDGAVAATGGVSGGDDSSIGQDVVDFFLTLFGFKEPGE